MKRASITLGLIMLVIGAAVPIAASALTFSPPTFDFSANPGDTLSDMVRVFNEGAEPAVLRIELSNFTSKVGDEMSGTPDFYTKDEIRNGRELATWVNIINKDIVLAPGERGGIYFDIKVPADAGPGSYFGAMLVTSVAADNGPGVGVVGNTAMLMLLRVNGEVVEKAKLSSFAAIPKLSSKLPIEFEARIENEGSVHLRPFGEIRIKNILGRTVAVLPINRFEYKSVLPGGARRYSTSWLHQQLADGTPELQSQLKNFAFGPYTAELSMEYGDKKEQLTDTTRFWVFPWLLILIVSTAFAGTLAIIIASLGWYRKRVISQFERGKK